MYKRDMSVLSEPPHDNTKTNWNTTLLVGALTALVTLSGYFLIFKADIDTSGDDQVMELISALQIDVRSLREALREQEEYSRTLVEANRRKAEENMTLRIEIFRLQNKLEERNQNTARLESFVENMPFAAWAMRINADGSHTVEIINEKYTAKYGLTRKTAIGKTHFELHPVDLASVYYASDLQVLQSEEPLREEVFLEVGTGEMVLVVVVRFKYITGDGEVLVAGMIIEQEDK